MAWEKDEADANFSQNISDGIFSDVANSFASHIHTMRSIRMAIDYYSVVRRMTQALR